MINTVSGLLLLVFAGAMNASFTMPMKFTRRWAWENTWLAWTIFALLLLPVVVTSATVPELGAVYRSTDTRILLEVIGFGTGWGVAQVLFGLAVDAIGIALSFSLVLGTAAAVGTLVPLLRLHPERLNSPAGLGVLAGVALVLVGVAVCAVAGRMREKAVNTGAHRKTNVTLGLALAILAGCGGSFVNFGLAFGTPLVASAAAHGAAPLNASNAVWLPLMMAGAAPNLLYCLWLLVSNRTGSRFSDGGAGHWALAFVMGFFWFASTLLYGVSTVKLGAWGPILGWPVYMSLIVIVASLLGMLLGEWKNSGSRSLRVQWLGVVLLIAAVFILADTTRFFS